MRWILVLGKDSCDIISLTSCLNTRLAFHFLAVSKEMNCCCTFSSFSLLDKRVKLGLNLSALSLVIWAQFWLIRFVLFWYGVRLAWLHESWTYCVNPSQKDFLSEIRSEPLVRKERPSSKHWNVPQNWVSIFLKDTEFSGTLLNSKINTKTRGYTREKKTHSAMYTPPPIFSQS